MQYGSMRRFGFILGIAAGLVGVEGMSARAAVLTYTFDPGTSFTLDNGGTGDLTGSFTINPPSLSFSATDDVVITGGPAAGTYAPRENAFGTPLSYENTSASAILDVEFTPNLNSAPGHAALNSLVWFSLVGPPSSGSSTVSGGATLIPEPSTWAMMLLGFGGLGFLGYRQTRKGQAATA
jgi:hypothetical protein